MLLAVDCDVLDPVPRSGQDESTVRPRGERADESIAPGREELVGLIGEVEHGGCENLKEYLTFLGALPLEGFFRKATASPVATSRAGLPDATEEDSVAECRSIIMDRCAV